MDGINQPCPECGCAVDEFADQCPNGHPLSDDAPLEPLPPRPVVAEPKPASTSHEDARLGAPHTLVRIDGTGFMVKGNQFVLGRKTEEPGLAAHLADRYPNVSRAHLTVGVYPTHFVLTDTSINGTFRDDGTRLPRDTAVTFASPCEIRLARNCQIRLQVAPGSATPPEQVGPEA